VKHWQVFVDQSKFSLEKGGSAALDAFLGLTVTMNHRTMVDVHPAILPRTIKSKQAPTVRCINEQTQQAMDIGYVDSVDKVYRILTKHMKVKVRPNDTSVWGCLGIITAFTVSITLSLLLITYSGRQCYSLRMPQVEVSGQRSFGRRKDSAGH
jgi:hypothetical protein